MRRNVLRTRWSVSTVDDLLAKLPHIVEWLTRDWFRLTEKVVDRENRNHARADVSAHWRRVQAAFRAWTGAPSGEAPQPRKRMLPNIKQLKAHAAGCIGTYVATLDLRADSVRDFMREWRKVGREVAESAVQGVRAKRQQLMTAGRGFSVNEADIPF